jgi:asparagine synthetase B (glutamine-hydrolysing)
MPAAGREPSLGPSRDFLHIRIIDDRPVAEGCAHWAGGTPIPGGEGPPDGVFAQWSWDGEQIVVHTDRMGVFPIYYFADERQFCVSASLTTLLHRGAPRDLDIDALGVFLRLGYFLDEDTAFTSIRAVPPVRSLTWAGGRPRVDRVHREPERVSVSYDEAVDGFIERVRDAISRRLTATDETFVMPLSGGADSRHIILELARQNRLPDRVVTAVQNPAFADVAVAKELSDRLGMRQSVVDGVLDAGWNDEARKNWITNFCSDEHVWYLPVADDLVASTSTSYDGLGGDLLSAPLSLEEPVMQGIVAGRIEEQLEDAFYSHRDSVLRAALTPEFYAQIPESRVRERIAADLRCRIEWPNPWSGFYWAHLLRRELTLTPHATLSHLTVHTPFLDREVVDFMSGLPMEMMFGGRLHADAIRRAFPRFADVPFAREVKHSRLHDVRHRLARLPRRAAIHLRAHSVGPRSRFLRRTPSAVRQPALTGALGGFNRRALWLRQVELLARDELAVPD